MFEPGSPEVELRSRVPSTSATGMKLGRLDREEQARFRPWEPDFPRSAMRHQVVTLAFLAKHPPAPQISEQLARSLISETGASVVLLRLQACEGASACAAAYDGKATAVDWAPSEVVLQGQSGMPSNLLKTDAGFHLLTLNLKSGQTSPESVASSVGYLARHFRHVLIEALSLEIATPT